MVFPFLPSTYKSVLHIPKLVCWAPKRHQNKLLLELNGYEQRPIAALITSCVEILIKLQGTKIKYFSGPLKVRALKTETAKQQTTTLLRGQNRAGFGGEKTLLPQ